MSGVCAAAGWAADFIEKFYIQKSWCASPVMERW